MDRSRDTWYRPTTWHGFRIPKTLTTRKQRNRSVFFHSSSPSPSHFLPPSSSPCTSSSLPLIHSERSSPVDVRINCYPTHCQLTALDPDLPALSVWQCRRSGCQLSPTWLSRLSTHESGTTLRHRASADVMSAESLSVCIPLVAETCLFSKSLCPVHTGDYSRRIRRQFVAEFGDSRRFWRQSPNSATIVASVDRALGGYFVDINYR